MSVKRGFLIIGLMLVSLVVQAGPKVESWTTGNGAKVLYVHAPTLPMVDLRLVFDAGSARDGERPGVAMLTNALLGEAAGPWNADEVAERLESVGAELSVTSLRDMGVVSLRSLTDPAALDVAVETLNQVLVAPRFEQADYERNLQQMQIVLRQSEQSPGEVASRAFYAGLYGDHPYAHDPGGNAESLAAMRRADVEAFFKRYYVARNAVVAVVGALDRAQAEALVERVLKGMPAGEHAPPLPDVPALAEGELRRIDFPSSQSHLYVGQPGMQRGDPDYFVLYVGNHVLGGSGLVSQLSGEVREKRGLSYSVYSYFMPMRQLGPFMMGAQTKNSQADETLRVMRDTLREYIAKGPSEEELEAAKRNITGGFPLRISSNGKIVEYLAMMGFYDYPLNYLDTLVDKVNAVTVEQIRDAFERRLAPDKLLTVVVGAQAETAAR